MNDLVTYKNDPELKSAFLVEIGTHEAGRCQCGCGRLTRVPQYSSSDGRYVAGVPVKFIRGHSSRGGPVKDYRRVLTPEGLRQAHRRQAELALGKPLPPSAVVHHADGSRSSNAPLVICQDTAYHSLLHRRMRVIAAGGNPNTDKICYRCKLVKELGAFSANRSSADGLCGYCKACASKRQAADRALGYSTARTRC